MTLSELNVALRRGDAIPAEAIPAEIRAFIADRLKPSRRGRPRRDGAKELKEAIALIERVETLSASLCGRQRAFNKLASGSRANAATIERYYRRAKRLEKVLKQLVEALDEQIRARNEQTRAIKIKYDLKSS